MANKNNTTKQGTKEINPSIKKKCKINCKITAVIISAIAAILILIYVQNSTSTPKDSKLIGYANGKKIYNHEIIGFLDELYGVPENFDFSAIPAEQKITLIKQLYTENAILKKANELNISKDKQVAKQIKQATSRIIKEEYLKHISKNVATREKIELLYKNHIDSLKGQDEVKARHILVKTESDASRIIKLLKTKSFDQVAQKESLDEYSKKNGGDLGYFTKGRMIPKFEKTVFNMKIGTVSSPFKTQYGWHIVKLEDKRKAEIPTLDEMYEKLKKDISFKAVTAHINEIKDQLEIKLTKTTSPAEKVEKSSNSITTN